jgi:DNA repair protein RecO (recombination protein O)
MAKYYETTGYLIHTKDFKNSSLIIEFFSQEYGMIHLLAKGIKKNKQLKSQLHYFNLLKVQFVGKSSLKTLTSVNILENTHFDRLVDKMAGMYLNELLHLSLLEGDVAKPLFQSYFSSLQKLGKMQLPLLLRRFEFQLLKYNGFEISVHHFSNPNIGLYIDETAGLVSTTKDALKLCSVSDLTAFLNGKKLTSIELKSVNKLFYAAVNLSLSHKKIHSRDMLKSLLSK